MPEHKWEGHEAGQLWMVEMIEAVDELALRSGLMSVRLGELPATAMGLMPDVAGEDSTPQEQWRDGWYAGVTDILIERGWVALPPEQRGRPSRRNWEMERIVSQDTLKQSDLIAAFEGTLRALNAKRANAVEDTNWEVFVAIEEGNTERVDYTDLRESGGYTIEELTDAINDELPGNFFFGAHEGDPALYGVWAAEPRI
jgi:hypothetical protein